MKALVLAIVSLLVIITGLAAMRYFDGPPAQPIAEDGLNTDTGVASPSPSGLDSVTSTADSGNQEAVSFPLTLTQGSASIQAESSSEAGFSSGKLETYTSNTLGLVFDFWQDGTVVINESGSILTIRIRGESQEDYPDDLIEVFHKDPEQTFLQSVEGLLASEHLNNCTAEPAPSSTPFDQQIQVLSNSELTGGCQYGLVDYASNGSPYFAYDSRYPDRFYFYDLGQAVWPLTGPGDGGDSWAATIQLSSFD